MNEKVMIFGAGEQGKKVLKDIKKKYNVVCIFDNDPRKENTFIDGIPVHNLKAEYLQQEYDLIFIGTLSGYKAITKQLIEMGVSETKINNSYVEVPTAARELFIKNLSSFLSDIDGEVAEGGVFQGEFAKVINNLFPKKTLHLYDTFEGFDARDIEIESSFSNAKKGDYAITSEQMVLNKMNYPDKCIIHKGFFPETATNVSDRFCFVNLDFDLYNPTKAGLEFFGDRMVKNGCILIHDYFSTQYTGVKKAVDEFIETKSKLRLMPIGDGISILVLGF